MPIQKVGVIGCGLMGSGIAQVCAQAGFPTVVREVSMELVEKGLIIRFEEPWGEQNKIIKYRGSEKGREIAKKIFEPYELLFPRSEDKK